MSRTTIERANWPWAEKLKLVAVGFDKVFDTNAVDLETLPNWPKDLNACAEMVASMRPEDANLWADELTRITAFGANPHWTHWFHLTNATAEQRCRAFVAVMEATKTS